MLLTYLVLGQQGGRYTKSSQGFHNKLTHRTHPYGYEFKYRFQIRSLNTMTLIPEEKKTTNLEDVEMVSHKKKSLQVKQKGQRLNQSC